MLYVIFRCVLSALIALTSLMPFGLASASDIQNGEPSRPAEDGVAPAVTRLSPLAIGAIPPAGKHLVRPREEVVEQRLRQQGKIAPGMSPDQIRSAVTDYYAEFSKKSSAWIAPEVQARALQRGIDSTERASAAVNLSTSATPAPVQPVSIKILALAVDFDENANDTVTYYATDGNRCKLQTVTTSGPLNGKIPRPGPRDNNTVWYEHDQTADAKFYEKLIFGYDGVGRVRLDLKDPNDGQPGINLQGYTLQDYYEHMAGEGNVNLNGAVEGWVTVDHSEGYYGAPDCSSHTDDGGGRVPVSQLVVHAVDKFNEAHPDYYYDTSPTAFWPQYDANHDGIVDSLVIIHAGIGEEAGGGDQGELAIWSHSWDLRKFRQWDSGYLVYEGDPNTTADDIVIGPYMMEPETAELGGLVEEFGHNFFGLPDLYSTDIENSIGFWSTMSAGTWGGWLGGSAPVGMPLYFRMIAQCGPQFCNWHEPIRSISYHASPTKITIGQLESTPEGAYKGVKINLPDVVVTEPGNRAGSGKGAYTGSGLDNAAITLDRKLRISRSDVGRLSFHAYWDIEEDRDYGYVMVNDGKDWTILDDLDGVLRETNPFGNNLGQGLTGSGKGKLRFDLAAYRGKTITIRFLYKTDASNTGAGWWLDDLALDGKFINRFEEAIPPGTFTSSWTNSSPGWVVVPSTKSYPSYYLVEWRSNTKYDQMLKTAYVTSYADTDEWQVQRVPYNIPGAVLYYCDTHSTETYKLRTKMTASPSFGPKFPLLVVDVNYQPMRLDDIVLDARKSSYDAALTLQKTKAFTITQVAIGGTITEGSWHFPSQSPVKQFDDANGYYAGVYAGSPCPEGTFCLANEGGSAVIPAYGRYTTRVTHYDGITPYTELYGQLYRGSILGSGNPGDNQVQYGVRIKLLGKSRDNRTAELRFNAPPER